MKTQETFLKGCFVIEPKTFVDDRGLFFESYKKREFDSALGVKIDFLQTNESISKFGALRGLHFQKGEHAQSKLVRVIKGEVLDVVVDLRPNSGSFGEYFKLKLSGENKKMIFIPKGMAHGFVVLSKEAILNYQCDNYYHQKSEGGLIYNDPELKIDWEIEESKLILSEKDKTLPTFKELFQ